MTNLLYDPAIQESIKKAANFIHQADALIIAAGAGMGVDSGLPDFRGNEGLWKAYPALHRAGLSFMEIANPMAFEKDPESAWGFYGHRLALYRNTIPHEGFSILKRWGSKMSQGHFVFTSNVDGQFQKAGYAESHLYECHGSIHYHQCTLPCNDQIWRADAFKPIVDSDHCRLVSKMPTCPYCRCIARPNILMFGDWAWIADRASVQRENLNSWLIALENPVIIEIGAGTAVSSVRDFSKRIIDDYNGQLIRINPTNCTLTRPQDIGLPLNALETLTAIDHELGHYWQD